MANNAGLIMQLLGSYLGDSTPTRSSPLLDENGQPYDDTQQPYNKPNFWTRFLHPDVAAQEEAYNNMPLNAQIAARSKTAGNKELLAPVADMFPSMTPDQLAGAFNIGGVDELGRQVGAAGALGTGTLSTTGANRALSSSVGSDIDLSKTIAERKNLPTTLDTLKNAGLLANRQSLVNLDQQPSEALQRFYQNVTGESKSKNEANTVDFTNAARNYNLANTISSEKDIVPLQQKHESNQLKGDIERNASLQKLKDITLGTGLYGAQLENLLASDRMDKSPLIRGAAINDTLTQARTAANPAPLGNRLRIDPETGQQSINPFSSSMMSGIRAKTSESELPTHVLPGGQKLVLGNPKPTIGNINLSGQSEPVSNPVNKPTTEAPAEPTRHGSAVQEEQSPYITDKAYNSFVEQGDNGEDRLSRKTHALRLLMDQLAEKAGISSNAKQLQYGNSTIYRNPGEVFYNAVQNGDESHGFTKQMIHDMWAQLPPEEKSNMYTNVLKGLKIRNETRVTRPTISKSSSPWE